MHEDGPPPHARQRLPTAQEGIEIRNRELEAILYTVSHDLRSPLVTIQGFGYELSRSCDELRAILAESAGKPDALQRALELLDTDIAESLHFIHSGATKMDSLLSGLLKLSRLGRAPLSIARLDMNELVHNVVNSLQQPIEAAHAQVTVEPLPQCNGDESQLQQLFTALLENSLKFRHPSRGCTIRVFGSDGPQQVVYCVEDNGVGIATEHLERIFDFGYQLRPQQAFGAGVGLPVAQRITLRHGGTIYAESSQDHGTKFLVMLPVAS